jgi:glycerophosphoryl diester phosphodiesterase
MSINLPQIFASWPTLDGNPPKILGHGGEKFYLPEHTTGSYELAAIAGKIIHLDLRPSHISQLKAETNIVKHHYRKFKI